MLLLASINLKKKRRRNEELDFRENLIDMEIKRYAFE
jgi:hypothetical protein